MGRHVSGNGDSWFPKESSEMEVGKLEMIGRYGGETR